MDFENIKEWAGKLVFAAIIIAMIVYFFYNPKECIEDGCNIFDLLGSFF